MEWLSSLLKNRIFLWLNERFMYGVKGRAEIDSLKEEIGDLKARKKQ